VFPLSPAVILTLLWVRATYPNGIPADVTDRELLASFYRWVRRNRHRDPCVRRLLRQARFEKASPWN
jgi:hypothetical protein